VWDGMSSSAKALYLTNAERVVRGLLPLEAVHPGIVTIAQNYAALILTTGNFSHTINGTTPSSRLNSDPAINGCSEGGFIYGPENLYAAAPSTSPMPVESAVYGWIYDDAGSGWGHRRACFALFNNNFGPAGSEGFMGIGLSSGNSTVFGPTFTTAVVVVYNFVDPCPTSVLPVELTTFTALLNGKNIELIWETASEVNNYGFDIERHNPNVEGENTEWIKIDFVKGHGNSNSPKFYSFIDNSVSSGKYSYRLKQIDIDGTYEHSDIVEVELGLPTEFSLSQNYPNPFNPTTTINYTLPEDGNVALRIYDVLGNEVKVLENGYKTIGNYSHTFDASNLTSGIYFYTIRSGNYSETKQMLLLK
ncbi:MAG: T9SS type A sorting domain-containing protein, partial [Melioribacteraceae bacterium]